MTLRSSLSKAWRYAPSLILLLVWLGQSLCWGVPSASATPANQSESTRRDLGPGFPSSISLQLGEIRSVPVENIERVAIGDPNVLDITIVSSTEILLQAKSAGTTNLIVWDKAGQHVSNVEVSDRASEALEGQLRTLVSDLKLSRVQVRREHDKVFLIGEVTSQSDLDRLEQMLAAYKAQVTNLVTVSAPPAPPKYPPLVKLTGQLIDISRSDLEKLGVKWSEGLSLTEPAVTDRTLKDALTRWGTSFDRSSVVMTLSALVQQNRARVLEEPKLVTVSGKSASSFIGLDVPVASGTTAISTATATVSTSVTFRSTGILLNITPTVHEPEPSPDGSTAPTSRQVTTIIAAEISGIDKSVGVTIPSGTSSVFVPGFKIRKTNTEVTMGSGETVVIAGLLEIEDAHNLSQVPALGSIPLFGRLFRTPEISSSQRELVIAVTPEVLEHETQEPDREKATALEHALAGAKPVVQAGPNTPLHYAMHVQDRIAKVIRWPLSEKKAGQERRLKLRLHVTADGTLQDALIAESSGSDALDAEALRAARAQTPYLPFPPELTVRDLWIEAAIVFRP